MAPVKPTALKALPLGDSDAVRVFRALTLNDAQRDAEGRFPRDASPDDLVVHQQDIQAVVNAMWEAGAEAVTIQGQLTYQVTEPRQLAGAAPELDLAVPQDGDAGRVIAAIFEALETVEQPLRNFRFPDNRNDTAHSPSATQT